MDFGRRRHETVTQTAVYRSMKCTECLASKIKREVQTEEGKKAWEIDRSDGA